MQKLEKRFFKEKQKLYKDANDKHQGIIKPILKQYQTDYNAAKRTLCLLPRDANYDPNDFCNQPDVAYPDLPEFLFDFPEDSESVFMNANVTKESMAVLLTVTDIEDITTFQEAITALTVASSIENKAIFSKNKFSRKVMAIGDAIIPLSDSASRGENDFSLTICSTKNSINSKLNPYLTTQVVDSSFEIEENGFEYTLKFVDGTTLSGTTYVLEPSSISNVIILKNMFGANNGFTLPLPVATESISGVMTFTNGVKKKFLINDFVIAEGYCCPRVFTEDFIKTENNSITTETFIPKGFGYRQIGIADYKKVVQEICCYDAGEVAHIENIMATEFKEKTTEKTTTRETTLFESQETEKESLSDTTTAQRFEMQSEVAKILQEQKQNEGFANVKYKYGETMSLDAGASFANNTSKEQSNRQAVTQAKDITQRAMERIVTKTKTEKTVKITESFKDTNSHIFDNRGGTSHVSGVYRYINAIYKNQVFNYGKRLMYEFMIPEPSKLHRLGAKAVTEMNANLLKEPIDPKKIILVGANIKLDFTDINETNYKELAAQYGADVEVYPANEIYLNKTFSGGAGNVITVTNNLPVLTGESSKENLQIAIPKGYQTSNASIKVNRSYEDSFNNYHTLGVVVGNFNAFMDMHSTSLEVDADNETLNPFKDTISVSYQSVGSIGFNIAIAIKCTLTTEGIASWQKDTFDAIIKGYNEQLRIYNEQVAQNKATGVQILDSNPLFYRQIEQLVLRKNCISYLIDTNKFGQDMYNANPTFENAQVQLSQEMDDYTSLAKFMEQAFEWNIISYNFYPYYWGDKNDWSDLYKFDSNDAIFRNFMQAGLARVVVTVKPGFEDAVMHYMTFGQIWNGGQMPVLGNPMYLSLVDELREQEYFIEETWETVLPTNLVALQESGVALKGDGLPCAPDCKEAKANNPFIKGTTQLVGIKPIL